MEYVFSRSNRFLRGIFEQHVTFDALGMYDFEKFLLYVFDFLLGKCKTSTKLDWRFNYSIFEYTLFDNEFVEREGEKELISCVY